MYQSHVYGTRSNSPTKKERIERSLKVLTDYYFTWGSKQQWLVWRKINHIHDELDLGTFPHTHA